MEGLTYQEQQAVLRFLEEIYCVGELEAWLRHAVSQLLTVIPADTAAYHEVDHHPPKSLYVVSHLATAYRRGPEVFEAHMHEHPLIWHYLRTQDRQALKIRDLLPVRTYNRTALYNEIYRPVGLEYDLTIQVAISADASAGITLHRASRDFSDRERELLRVIRPHVLQALRNARAWTCLQQELATTSRGADIARANLSVREQEILDWAVQGKSNDEIGGILRLSPRTVGKHLENIYRKLGVGNRTAAARLVLSSGR